MSTTLMSTPFESVHENWRNIESMGTGETKLKLKIDKAVMVRRERYRVRTAPASSQRGHAVKHRVWSVYASLQQCEQQNKLCVAVFQSYLIQYLEEVVQRAVCHHRPSSSLLAVAEALQQPAPGAAYCCQDPTY